MINKKKMSVALLSSLGMVPVIGSVCIGVSCSKKQKDDAGIEVSTKDVEVDYNNGVGELDVILTEQPIDNKAYIYIINAEGPHHVELLDDRDSIYHGHPAGLYDVENGVAHIFIGFTEFIGETTKTVIHLQVRYNNRKNQWIQKDVYGINLFTNYVHPDTERVHIFSLNDFHGCAEGYGESKDYFPSINYKNPGAIRLMNKIQPLIESSPGSFLVTAGDNNSGDMFSTSLHGESIYKVLQAMGARYSAVGNHAFDWGAAPMTTKQFDNWARTKDTRGNYFLASNILNGSTTREVWVDDLKDEEGFNECYTEWVNSIVPWADPYKIVNMNGHLVCLIGLTTKAAAEDGNRDVTDHLSFIDYNPAVNYSVYKCYQEVGDRTFNAIESFILLTHVESDQSETGTVTGAAAELAEDISFEGVDAIISGHSHKAVNAVIDNHITGKKICLGQAETEGRRYLDLSLTFDNTKAAGEKKLKDVSMDVINCTNRESWEKDWNAAHDDMLSERKAATENPVTANVMKVFDDQTYFMDKKLNQPVSPSTRRYGTLKYPAVQVQIGHKYYNNERPWGATEDPTDGGYICDQLGAWINYANIVGFSKMYEKDIAASPGGLTYPAISLINQDSMKISYDDEPSASGQPVLLKDMYNIQGYENQTIFGYISIWQLAAWINHSLSGRKAFNYDDGVNPDYGQYYDGKDKTDEDLKKQADENDLSIFVDNYEATSEGDPVFQKPTAVNKQRELCKPAEFPKKAEYKKVQDACCLYPCGPAQWYGFRFNVIPERVDANGNPVHDRAWRVNLFKPESAISTLYPLLPDIYIMDPRLDEDNIYGTIRRPDQWLHADEYLEHHPDGMIPMVTNSFLFGGANWETPMAAVYMKHNQGRSPNGWPIIQYSHITREMMIKFTETAGTAEATKYPFDMPLDICDWLVHYPTDDPEPELE